MLNIPETIKSDDLIVASFGSKMNSEFDLFVTQNNWDRKLDYKSLIDFSDKIKELINTNFAQTHVTVTSHILKNVQKKPVLHLLTYPSIYFFSKWERLSFAAYIYDKGQFLIGNRNYLNELNNNYRNRTNKPINSLLFEQICYYTSIAYNYFIYYRCNHTFISLKDIFEKISYAIRFTITELEVNKLSSDDKISFWDWQEFFEYFKNNEEVNTAVIIIKKYRESNKRISRKDLDSLFKFYFEYVNKVLE